MYGRGWGFVWASEFMVCGLGFRGYGQGWVQLKRPGWDVGFAGLEFGVGLHGLWQWASGSCNFLGLYG